MGDVEYLQNSRFLAKSAWKFALGLAKKKKKELQFHSKMAQN